MEKMTARVREGRVGYVVIVAREERPGKAIGLFGGAVNLEESARAAIDEVAKIFDAHILNRTLPERDPNLGADYVCYNCAKAPLSYDFFTWLVDAEMTRVREGAPAPLKVAFWFGRDGKTGLKLASRKQMFENVVRPLLPLIGAVDDDKALGGRFKELFVSRDIIAAAKAGEPVPALKASAIAEMLVAEWLRGWPRWKPPVTITLREAGHWPHRNSDLMAWRKFAADLQLAGENVIFVRDTAKAFKDLFGFATFPDASLNLDMRLALYQSAKANLFVSNGPATLAWFTDKPWLMFQHLEPDGHGYGPGTPSFWREEFGMEPGGQLPWAKPDQRIVWGKDSYENLVEAWEQLELN